MPSLYGIYRPGGASTGNVYSSTGVQTITVADDLVTFRSAAQGTTGMEVRLYQDTQSPASATDVIGNLTFYGRDNAQNVQQYAGIRAVSEVVSSGSESGSLTVQVMSSGSLVNGMVFDGLGIKLRGAGAAATPDIRWNSFTTTGIYNPQNGVGLACNATAHLVCNYNGSALTFGVFGATAVVRQTSGANLTNSVTSGGTDDTIADYSSLSVYATDAATIRNNIYQLARKLKQVNDALRLYGFLT